MALNVDKYLEERIRMVCDAPEDIRLVSRWSRLEALGASTDGASSSELTGGELAEPGTAAEGRVSS